MGQKQRCGEPWRRCSRCRPNDLAFSGPAHRAPSRERYPQSMPEPIGRSRYRVRCNALLGGALAVARGVLEEELNEIPRRLGKGGKDAQVVLASALVEIDSPAMWLLDETETVVVLGRTYAIGAGKNALDCKSVTKFLKGKGHDLARGRAAPPNGHGLQRPGHRALTGSADPGSMPETTWNALFPGPLQGLVRWQQQMAGERGRGGQAIGDWMIA